ncbi:methyltransferase domain-containing protein [Clostridium tyrobutyricum]|jgi:tRNA G37 N-methylase Trm5|uniref:SAM-dependent methyltransferase, MraW methylase family n=2 Tax=Clostridium tyrobutyricum TaxID=1519 RepID=W6N464_CLOTY|nr:class I SAM-dependent methyltransferase [Clostridium tyrobutyricum]AND84913.1 rRNA methylase [Clostridium tyrobutyricum]ANP69486.1 SAM-dependent methyltransferase [Clostridium tyrobutyricum]MBR9649399.1 methyltransferase domain-containing protein [Clostridium tyrobutyricum]MBV4422654.1 methyltransferase domain-containing protein [Clostridium tyrobutyricum]MBV4423716.1 methyltransferase domain-containing protein [Clostridium tyrobutyricum]
MNKNYFTNAVNIAKDICRKKINKGDIVVDATMGNGNDTLFLSELVGDSGKVYAFDIQQTALKNTYEKISKNGILQHVKLINDSHENMDMYINDKVKLVIFNLGYLPKGDHSITTTADTTLLGLKKALDLIEANGIVILVVYYGHEEGNHERDALEDYIKNLNQRTYNVVKLCFANQVNSPPMLIIIEKR